MTLVLYNLIISTKTAKTSFLYVTLAFFFRPPDQGKKWKTVI